MLEKYSQMLWRGPKDKYRTGWLKRPAGRPAKDIAQRLSASDMMAELEAGITNGWLAKP